MPVKFENLRSKFYMKFYVFILLILCFFYTSLYSQETSSVNVSTNTGKTEVAISTTSFFTSVSTATLNSIPVSSSTAETVSNSNSLSVSSETLSVDISTDTDKSYVVKSTTPVLASATTTTTISTSTLNSVSVSSSTSENFSENKNLNSAGIATEIKNIAENKNMQKEFDSTQRNIDKSVSMSLDEPEDDNVGTYYKSGSIIEKQSKDTKYAVDVPTTTTQGIAGEKALEKLSVKKTTDTAKEDSSKKETKSDDTKKIEKKDKSGKSIFSSDYYVKLPWQSQLILSGRKLIGVNYKSTIYDKEESGKRSNYSSFSMEQELQMKIKGKVGRKLELNVDFDDTQDDKKDISITYRGDPNEFVQEASFGDINVSLPSTEFFEYSKELFGLKVDTKYKKLNTMAFFSKTKGYSESKQFKGNTKLEKLTIPDTAYIRFKYYSIIKDPSNPKPIKQGTAKVYLDKNKVSATDYIVITTATVLKAMRDNSFTYSGNFVKLVAGQDYTIDYNTGIITFKNILSKQYVVAIDYQFMDGTWLSDTTNGDPQIIKDTNNTSVTTESLSFYSLGNYQIIRDNGRDSFILDFKDLNNTTPATVEGGKPVPNYPSNITVDFENGIFYLSPIEGFPLHDSLYTSNTHLYNFVTEYRYKVKIFNLRAGIVPMSEKVTIDGVKLKINEDYFIDYDVGILTILKESLISENSTIDISYDYSPFGSSSSGESTLIGLRSQLNITNNISVGGSFVYEFSAKDTALPDIYSTPSSKLVAEVDSKINNLKITDGLTFSANAEYATSQYQKNTTGKAILESMEEAKQETSLSLIDDNWQVASTPDKSTYNLSDITLKNYDIEKKEIDPNLEIISGEKQQVMDIKYDLLASQSVSVCQIVSQAGYDLSDKLYIEIWLKGDGKNETFQLDYATSISENSDSYDLYRTKLYTEDTDGDGLLSPWEDIGRDFYNKNGTASKIGANNGKIDTEDLNGNNILDTYETNVSSFSVTVNWYGWKKIQFPLNIVTTADQDKWRNIKTARVTVSGNNQQQGTVTIGKISVVGNKWKEVKQSGSLSTFHISSIGRDDPKYVSLLSNSDYRSLYEIDDDVKRDEQALSLQYETTSSDELYAKTTYVGRAADISLYETFGFFVFVSSYTADDTKIIVRAGGDENNYLQYSLTVSNDMKGKWNLIRIKQDYNTVRSRWISEDKGVTSFEGDPSLNRIAYIQLGIQTSQADSGEIWFNEIHLKDAKTQEGNAWKVNSTLRWNGTNFVGATAITVSRKSIDKDFQTFSPGTYDRDYLEDNASLDFKGLDVRGVKVLPLTASITKTKIVTPLAKDNDSDTVSLLDDGKVVTFAGKMGTVVSGGVDLPKITLQYTRLLKDTQEIKRLEDAESLYANLVYVNPIDFDILPTSLNTDYKISNSLYKVYPDTPIEDTNNFLDLETAKKYMDIKEFLTLERTESIGVKTPFNFFEKVTFTPAYILTRVNEKNKRDFENQEIVYDKSLNQDIGATVNFKLAKWFQPSIVYHTATIETYDLAFSTITTNIVYPGQKKYIERSGITEFTWNLQAFDIIKTPYLKSLSFTTSYRMQDSDSYSNVDKNFSSVGWCIDKIWIRDNLLKEILPSYDVGSYIVKSVVKRDDQRVIGRYNPFENFNLKGKLLPLKTLSLSFTFSEGKEESYITGTSKNSYTKIWPDLLIGISRLDKIFNFNWMSDTQLNLRHSKKTVVEKGISLGDLVIFGGDYKFKIKKKIDILFQIDDTKIREFDTTNNVQTNEGEQFAWLIQTGMHVKQWRFNLKYSNAQSWAKNATGKLSDQILENSINAQIYSDLLFPKGIKFPFFGVIPLKNRLILDSNVFYTTQSSNVNIQEHNLQNYGFKLDVDYEISKNFRYTLVAGISRYAYTYTSEQNYTLLELGSKLTIQF